MKRKPLIGVIGGSECVPDIARMAEEVGRRIAERGGVLVCGGLGGVMEASAAGAQKAGGLTIGILPDGSAEGSNDHIDIPIVTGMGYARNVIIVKTADVVIAIDGRFGTLSEVAHSLVYEKKVISLQSWEVDAAILPARDAQEAVDLAFKVLEEK